MVLDRAAAPWDSVALLSTSPISLLSSYFTRGNHSNVSESVMADDPSVDLKHVPLLNILVYTLMFGIGAPKNFQVVRCLLFNKTKLYSRSRHHLLLLNLAIADSIVLFISVPAEIGWRVTSDWRAGNVGCKVFQFVRVFGLYASSMILICISLDRYYAVVKPFRYSSMSCRISKLLRLSWIMSFLISTPQVSLQTRRFHVCCQYDLFRT